LLFSLSLLISLTIYLFTGLNIPKNLIRVYPLLIREIWTLEIAFHYPLFAKIFRLLVIIITRSVFLFTYDYIRADGKLGYFIRLLVIFVLSIIALIYIPNIILLILGWDGLGLRSYLLVIFFGSNRSLRSGILTVLSNRVGDSFIVIAIGLSFIRTTFLPVDHISLSAIGGTLILFARFTKRAQAPFSAWLPAAIAAPTPVSALVHSSTLVTAGVYLVFSFSPTLFKIELFSSVIYYVGVSTCLLASLTALFETDLKKIIALSTLSQLGIIFFSLGLNLPWLTFFHMRIHAIFKALLFIRAGVYIINSGPQDLRYFGNIWYSIPWTRIIFVTRVLALRGLPFLSGFYSKDLIVERFLLGTKPVTTATICYMRILLTSAYSFRMLNMLLWSPIKGRSSFYVSGERDTTIFAYLPLGTLVVVGGPCLLSYSNFIRFCYTSMPFFLKVITLLLLTTSAIGGYKLRKASLARSSFSAIGWLGFINPFNAIVRLGTLGWVNEKTWIEKLSGVGRSEIYVKPSFLKFHNFRFQSLITLMGVFTLRLLAIIAW